LAIPPTLTYPFAVSIDIRSFPALLAIRLRPTPVPGAVASLLIVATLYGLSGLRQPGGVRETDHVLRAAWHGAIDIAPSSIEVIDRDDDCRAPDRARRGYGPARQRSRTGPSALSQPVEAMVLRAPPADAHLLGEPAIVSPRGRDVVTGLRGRAPPLA
jgi:hypothetical protein